MKRQFRKWFYVLGGLLLAGIFLIVVVAAGCGSLQQHQAETRVRHYFTLAASAPLTDSVIVSALQARFPIGTPVNQLKTWLTGQGLGVDGHSSIWETNQCVYYQVEDYADAFLSMRHIQISVSFDASQKIQDLQASVYSYSL